MQLNVTASETGKVSSTVEGLDSIFGEAYNEPLIHQIVTAYQAAARQGTSAQKNRSAVRGGGRKPWKQKGTGNARAGTIRSPLWRGGGVTFAATQQDYSQKVNKKMYRKAIRSVWAELNRSDRLVVMDAFEVAEAKTKTLLAKLKAHDLENALIVTDELDEKLYLAARNLRHVDVRDVQDVNPVVLIAYDKVIVTVKALEKLQEVIG